MAPWTATRARGAARSLRYLEVAAWTLGAVLVVTYAGAQWWYARGREEGIAAFAAARDEALRSPAAGAELSASSVDMSTWSRARIEHYRESMRTTAVPLAVLRIPAVKLAVPVFDGTSEQNLNRGAGRIAGTAQIGERGNVGIAAHRDGFFRVLKDIKEGDALVLDTPVATEQYRVEWIRITTPDDVSVIDPTPGRAVTLVGCYPFYHVGPAPQRFIVRALPAAGSPAGS